MISILLQECFYVADPKVIIPHNSLNISSLMCYLVLGHIHLLQKVFKIFFFSNFHNAVVTQSLTALLQG